MKHRTQVVNFRTSEFPLSGAFASFLLKARYTYINIGELFEYTTDILFHTVGVLTNRVDFTLVNVCCPFTHFSFGSLPAPPKEAWPNGKLLLLTFATSAATPYDALTVLEPNNVRHHSNHHTRWSHHSHRLDYVTVSVDLTLGDSLGLRYPKWNELQYIYNLIGGMTKSVIRRQTAYRPLGDGYEELHDGHSLIDLHARISAMPIKNLFTQIPYHLWVFNRHLWTFAPNVLPQRLLTPRATMYFFMYLHSIVRKSPRVHGDVTMKRLGLTHGANEGILEVLTKSVVNMVQLIKTPGDRQFSDLELLAPAMIKALLSDGEATLPRMADHREQMTQQTRTLVADLQSRENDLGYLFLPPQETARKLMLEDLNYIDTLETAMAYPPRSMP